MNLKKILAGAVASVMAVSAMSVFASADEESYTVGIAFQSNPGYLYRNDISQKDLGTNNGEDDSDWDYADATVDKDGTYTVSVEGIPTENETGWFIVKLDTNIPVAKEATITIKSVKVDGADATVDATKALPEGEKNLAINIINEYNADMKGNPAIENKPFTALEVTFEVSGLSGAAADPAGDENNGGDENNNTPADPTPDPADGKDPANTGIEGVAVVAGLAVLATGALVIAKKRK